jgi:SAM-dependent methyltransferase
MSNPTSDWIGFWNSEHSIYVNARHLDLHYQDIADHFVALGFDPAARILDYGCGEAVHADRVAARAGALWLCEASSRVRDNLRSRFRDVNNIRVTEPDEIQALPDGAFDLIVANSVVQYWTPQELDATLRTWRRLLAPAGRLVLADVIPPGLSPLRDALALLRYAAQRGFLLAAIAGLFRTAFSPYRRLRSELGITTYEEADIIAHLRKAGLMPQRLPYNFEHQPRRMSFVATVDEVPS